MLKNKSVGRGMLRGCDYRPMLSPGKEIPANMEVEVLEYGTPGQHHWHNTEHQ